MHFQWLPMCNISTYTIFTSLPNNKKKLARCYCITSKCAKAEHTITHLTVNLFDAWSSADHFTEQWSVTLNYCIVTNSGLLHPIPGILQGFPGVEISSFKFKYFPELHRVCMNPANTWHSFTNTWHSFCCCCYYCNHYYHYHYHYHTTTTTT